MSAIVDMVNYHTTAEYNRITNDFDTASTSTQHPLGEQDLVTGTWSKIEQSVWEAAGISNCEWRV
jgi:hypothetical protein